MPLNPFGAAFVSSGFRWTAELCSADSDGDGRTNGEELGDPCCTWKEGDEPSPYMARFQPTHPGFNSHVQPEDYTAPTCGSAEAAPSVRGPSMSSFNEGEVQRVIEFKIKSYELPKRRTTYVNIPFNFPDLSAEVFHIVWGEAIVVLKRHLHHYTIQGCPELFDDDQVGRPIDASAIPASCRGGLGGGWAPGRLLWDLPSHAGQPIGRGVGIRSFVINVHFTDADQVAHSVFSTDGIRMHYTPTLRNFTVDTGNTIFLPAADTERLTIPPGKKRFFVTRTCKVVDSCSDSELPNITTLGVRGLTGAASPTGTTRMLGMLGSIRSCADIGKNQLVAARVCQQPIIAAVCIKTCSGVNGRPCIPKPGPIPVVAVAYHAHLLGTEMYQTIRTQAQPNSTRTAVDALEPGNSTDLGSQPAWHYDDQGQQRLSAKKLTISNGDVIQSTCVFDSSARAHDTVFGRETVDEMCFTGVITEHPTHEFVNQGDQSLFSGASFRCEGPMWTGELGPGEDGAKVAELHPVAAARVAFSNQLEISALQLAGLQASRSKYGDEPTGTDEITSILTTVESSSSTTSTVAPPRISSSAVMASSLALFIMVAAVLAPAL